MDTGGRTYFFLFQRHRLPLFINCERQAVLCSMFVFLFCNCFVPFVPLISSPNCKLFFSVFVNFIFFNFKTILQCLHVIPLVSFNDSFIVNFYIVNTKFSTCIFHKHTHTLTKEYSSEIYLYGKICDFLMFTYNKIVFFYDINWPNFINRLCLILRLFSKMYFLIYPQSFDDIIKFEYLKL